MENDKTVSSRNYSNSLKTRGCQFTPYNRQRFTLYLEAFLRFSGPVVAKKAFKCLHSSLIFLWLSPLWWGPTYIFEQTYARFTKEWFVPSLIEIGLMGLEKILREYFQYKHVLKNVSPWTIIWTNLNLHYIWNLSWKSELL
jgi:hypothetical protein